MEGWDLDCYYSSQMRNKTTAVDDIHLRVAEPRMFRARMTYKF